MPAYCMYSDRHSMGGAATFISCVRLRYAAAALLALSILVLTSAIGAPPDPVVERGLRHTSQTRQVAAAAIASANQLLDGKGIQLIPSWANPRESAPRSAEVVPVYLVAAPPKARATPATVPRGCSCVFVNPKVLAAFVKAQSTGSGRLKLNSHYVLTFMLLHEAGHVANKTSGAEFANGELSELNIEPSLAKAREEDADEFAADLLKDPLGRRPATSASLEATSVALELGNLSWNMQAQRSLDEFGATVIGKPSVFFDKNLTHPNLAWRILRANYLIHSNPTTKGLLDGFEEARTKGERSEPLFIGPKK